MALLALSAFQRGSSHLASVCSTPPSLVVCLWKGDQAHQRCTLPQADALRAEETSRFCRFICPSAERPWQPAWTAGDSHVVGIREGATERPVVSKAKLQHSVFSLASPGRQEAVVSELPSEISQSSGNSSLARRPFHASCSAQGPLEGDAAEFLDGRVARGGTGGLAGGAPGLTSTRREALALYRLVLRASRPFTWPNEAGVLWRDLLRASARQEFEACRGETDPELIARMLVQGRDAVDLVVERFLKKREELLLRDQDPLSAGGQQR